MTGRGKLWLVRHGETEWSASGRHTGRTDIPLSETGVGRAEVLAQELAGRQFAAVWASPLQRARETARVAGYGRANVDPDILEWDYGVYEGRTTPEIRREQPDWSVWTAEIKGGESVDDVALRARRVIDRAIAAPGDTALFSHGHFLRILSATWLGLPPRTGRLFALDTGAISILGYERDTRVIRLWNRTGQAPSSHEEGSHISEHKRGEHRVLFR